MSVPLEDHKTARSDMEAPSLATNISIWSKIGPGRRKSLSQDRVSGAGVVEQPIFRSIIKIQIQIRRPKSAREVVASQPRRER